MIRLAVDAMGGDGGAAVAVSACRALLARSSTSAAPLEIHLFGTSEALGSATPEPSCVLHPCADVITDDDSLATALRRRPDASMTRALEFVADGDADAVVSSGQTAALMALSRMKVGVLDGVSRPAIAKALLAKEGSVWLLDLGANIECPPRQLVEFAHWGDVLARSVGEIEQPRIALLNIGTEPGKGTDAVASAADQLRSIIGDRYVGFVEANQLFAGVADVIVCDGLLGNVALKSMEGTADMVAHLVGEAAKELSALEKTGAWLLRGALRRIRRTVDPERYNGASLVGLKRVVVKSHGSTGEDGFRAALEQAIMAVEQNVPARCAEAAGQIAQAMDELDQ